MVFTEEHVRANLRVKDGKRVFYLAAGDKLTPAANSFLRQEHVKVLPATEAKIAEYVTLFGAKLTEKPEHMTHLRGNLLVAKDHPRIRFRGMIDALEAELLLCMDEAKDTGLLPHLREVLQFIRDLIPADVLGEPVKPWNLCGMTAEQLREKSHFPQKYFDQPHFMPAETDGRLILMLNKVRTVVRQTELAAYDAFKTKEGGTDRDDIILALNRLSSLFWIFMIQEKARRQTHG